MQPSRTRGDTGPRSDSSKERSGRKLDLHPWDILLPRLLEALPQDVNGRADYLDALVAVVPSHHPVYHQIRASRSHLDMHILAQRELPLAEKGAGRLGDNPLERGSR